MTFILGFAGGWLIGMGVSREDHRYTAAGFVLFGLSLALCFV